MCRGTHNGEVEGYGFSGKWHRVTGQTASDLPKEISPFPLKDPELRCQKPKTLKT